MLEVKDLTKTFQGLTAVKQVSFGVEKGRIKALIGPNGAGKTTTFNMITGLITATHGTVTFNGEVINAYPPHMRAKKGISRTFQNIRTFPEMTALENVMVGCHLRTNTGLCAAALRLPLCRADEEKARERALQELAFVGLGDRSHLLAGSLAMGEQRLMEIARTLASEPELVLFDEPAAGLNGKETEQLAEDLLKIKERGITILLVEHDMRMVMRVADEIIVINYGTKIAQGTPEEIRNNSDVITAYLGK
ncbi:MAG: ABC transporter ATP-binding protein [Desulfuromonadaceae bacterium]|nr:ABC transporter ATP-binding protein [Desulfuromonadaceae bacterium]